MYMFVCAKKKKELYLFCSFLTSSIKCILFLKGDKVNQKKCVVIYFTIYDHKYGWEMKWPRCYDP